MVVWLVEDEARLAEFLITYLRSDGFFVEQSSSLEAVKAVVSARPFEPDVIILDRLLNQNDSINMLPDIKVAFSNARILILSAINTATEKAEALDRGADDYLGKPFAVSELMARLRALVRRPAAIQFPNYLRAGNVVLDTMARVAMVGDRRINLPNKEFMVLRALIQKPGQVFKKGTLFEQVWDSSTELETNVVEATITNLRRKLEDAAADVRIKNMRNAGYWIEA